MLQYLVILLDDTSVAYCHADNPLKERYLMPIEVLKKAIFWGMKENLMIQYVYPDYELPKEYETVIESIDHKKIGREIEVLTTVPQKIDSTNLVLRLTISDFVAKQYDIAALLPQVTRLNICLTDIETFTDTQISDYKKALATLNAVLVNLYKSQKVVQVNLLTDRLQLTEMHNCEAGVSNITVAPNGKFYLCPAFYYDEKMGIDDRMNHKQPTSNYAVGDLEIGLNIPNSQLLQIDHAPLCRKCDAYHCNRCVWLNQKLTWDINTPSRQQCIISHLERNTSRDLLIEIRRYGEFLPDKEIKEINYLDPFEIKEKW
ncbi:MAG: CXXX repeat peptide maturase [Paludibacteraceae bacterium]|jgi:CXXX repeat peptide maturase